MNKKKKHLLIICFIIMILAIIYWVGISNYITIEKFRNHQEALQFYIHNHYFLSGLVYSAFYATMIIFMIPGAIPLTVMGGFLFGPIAAIAFSLVGALMGCTLSFLGFKYFLYTWVNKRFEKEIAYSLQHFKRNRIGYILSLQLIPITPYPIINALASLSGMPLSTFMLTIALGTLPLIIISAYTGSHLASLKDGEPIFSKLTFFLLSILAFLSLLPTIIRYAKTKIKKSSH